MAGLSRHLGGGAVLDYSLFRPALMNMYITKICSSFTHVLHTNVISNSHCFPCSSPKTPCQVHPEYPFPPAVCPACSHPVSPHAPLPKNKCHALWLQALLYSSPHLILLSQSILLCPNFLIIPSLPLQILHEESTLSLHFYNEMYLKIYVHHKIL